MSKANKLIHGDCMVEMSAMEKGSIDLLLTDIPYNAVNRDSNGLRNLDKKEADVITFDLQNFLTEVVRVTSGSGYIFCEWAQISEIIEFMRAKKLSVRLCCWRKTNPSPMNGTRIWLSGAEYAVYFKKPNATFNEHCKNCVWDFPSGRGKQHPTEKPLKLFKYLVETSSNVGDTVFDPCVGSGTTAVAAIETGRNYIGIEMNKDYYDIATSRIEMIA